MPKLPSEKYTVTLNILLEYLEIADEQQLPKLWHNWSNCTKKQEFQVLTELLQAYTRSPEAFSYTLPVVTAKLIQDLQNFHFVSESMDDLKSGIQPFIIAEGSAEYCQANLEVSRLYGLLNSGEHSVMLADLDALQSREVASIPLSYFELERNLGMFGTLLGTVLGNQHVLTTNYRQFWNLLSKGLRYELQQIVDIKHYVKPAHILRSVQLVCWSWFNQRKQQLTPMAPDFVIILHSITLSTYMLPNLPPQLYKLAYPKPNPILNASQPLLTSSSVSSNATSITAGQSTVSGFSTPSGLTSAVTRSKGSWIANLQPISALETIVPLDIKVKDLIGSDPPPLLDNGSQICLSYHIRRGCWSTCRHVSTHGSTLSTAEIEQTKAYLTTQLRKMRPANPQVASNPQAASQIVSGVP